MEMLPPTGELDWSATFGQAISGQVEWTVKPEGVVTADRVSEDGLVATALIKGNGARLGSVYEVIATAAHDGGISDPVSFFFRIGPRAVS